MKKRKQPKQKNRSNLFVISGIVVILLVAICFLFYKQLFSTSAPLPGVSGMSPSPVVTQQIENTATPAPTSTPTPLPRISIQLTNGQTVSCLAPYADMVRAANAAMQQNNGCDSEAKAVYEKKVQECIQKGPDTTAINECNAAAFSEYNAKSNDCINSNSGASNLKNLVSQYCY